MAHFDLFKMRRLHVQDASNEYLYHVACHTLCVSALTPIPESLRKIP